MGHLLVRTERHSPRASHQGWPPCPPMSLAKLALPKDWAQTNPVASHVSPRMLRSVLGSSNRHPLMSLLRSLAGLGKPVLVVLLSQSRLEGVPAPWPTFFSLRWVTTAVGQEGRKCQRRAGALCAVASRLFDNKRPTGAMSARSLNRAIRHQVGSGAKDQQHHAVEGLPLIVLYPRPKKGHYATGLHGPHRPPSRC